MEKKYIKLLSELKTIEGNCVAKHAELLKDDEQFTRIINITRTIIKSLEQQSEKK